MLLGDKIYLIKFILTVISNYDVVTM